MQDWPDAVVLKMNAIDALTIETNTKMTNSMKLKSFLILVLMGCTAWFTSCNDSDDTVTFWTGLGTVQKQDGVMSIDFDGGRQLNVADSLLLVLHKAQTPGQRVIATFRYADEGRTPNTIYLADVYRVLTKPFFSQPTAAERDSLGNDPVVLSGAWIGGGHLNLKFRLQTSYGGLRPHFINLIDEGVTDDDGYTVLQLVHNQNGDPQELRSTGYASFPIGNAAATVKGYRIRYKTGPLTEQTVTVTFDDTEETPAALDERAAVLE